MVFAIIQSNARVGRGDGSREADGVDISDAGKVEVSTRIKCASCGISNLGKRGKE